ncbi:hypothetical protein Tsubulata_021772 [Turnera subulata]|uniref:Uncharacterized protein n=1 Tax=Turnera subulata TaxID=218843 RepID=A0A9Q0J4E9_9ROSI|nr:hypothetical protein Tsubulata_021772 [Turnera subulata]
MANPVHVKEAVVIKPSETTPVGVLSLSALDSQLFLRFTIEYLLVFRPSSNTNNPPGSDKAAFSSRVKAALSKILVPYYPLAGRVRARADGSGLEVVCRAQGAVFIQAISDHHTASEFNGAPRYVTQWRKLLCLQVADVLKGAPPLVVQLTWLKDGAATLGFGINHCVCDGIGSAEFLNSFAELATSQSRVAVGVMPKPVWDRHLIDSLRPQSCSPVSHPEFSRVPDLCGFLTRFSTEKLAPTSVIFDKGRLDELKRVALSKRTTASELPFTSFEVLSAHVWRSWARALNLPPTQILKLLFSVNVRNRVKPGIPSGFYGNAFVLGCAQTSVKDLTEKGLGYASMLIKRAKENVGNDYVNSVIESVRQSRASTDQVGVLILSQWSRLGLEKVDFGMGKPVHVGPVCSDRYCLILPVYNQPEAVKVMVALPSSGAEKYEHLVKFPYS